MIFVPARVRVFNIRKCPTHPLKVEAYLVSHTVSAVFGSDTREMDQMACALTHEYGIVGGGPKICLAGLLGLPLCGAGALRAPRHTCERVACSFLMNIDTWFAFWNVLDPELGQLPQ